MLFSRLFSVALCGFMLLSAATIPVARDFTSDDALVARDHADLASRGSGSSKIYVYKDYETDLQQLDEAEKANDLKKAQKLNKTINKNLQKQEDSINAYTDKTDKAYQKALTKANAIQQKIDAANAHFQQWMENLHN
ncbi:hypothetical protein BT96DRAFT_922736 [Gymnopus androsaceus JB14]|uniref:Uncharacterized protein n=1 Tax=Gymnopus androsaceus JB14 TaxID=1447944 RepID=A0A6A4HB40_9AGAR|nr:hypothetical protein BT96DRAFT_922736 [Gymnopus androsaceus JB14]